VYDDDNGGIQKKTQKKRRRKLSQTLAQPDLLRFKLFPTKYNFLIN